VRQYIELDDKIKALNKAIKEFRKTKDKTADSILQTMKQFEINDVNIKSGKLSYNKRTTKKPLNKKNLLTGLKLYFKEDVDRATDCSTFVLDSREEVVKTSLKRTINKQGKDKQKQLNINN
jgi:hypothetical protein